MSIFLMLGLSGTVLASPAIESHLERVEHQLRDADVSHLSVDQQAARTEALAHLNAYRQAGVFPHNHGHLSRTPHETVPGMFPHTSGQAPVFVDTHGTHCAVGYLIAATGHHAVVATVVRDANTAFVYEMSFPELDAWAGRYGLSRDELSAIQPTYNWDDADWDGIDDVDEDIIGTDKYLYDTDGDTMSDGEEVGPNLLQPKDTDSDGIIDALDTDDDNDGVLSIDEDVGGNVGLWDDDTDNDGIINAHDPDDDGDGIPTADEHMLDTDGDGIPNHLDADDDGDGIPTIDESQLDLDCDGIPDHLDADDNENCSDGVPDDEPDDDPEDDPNEDDPKDDAPTLGNEESDVPANDDADDGVKARGGVGCATPGTAGGLWVLALAAGRIRRERRR